MYFDSKQATAPGNSASVRIEVPAQQGQQRVIIATAHGRSRYIGQERSAGITLTIECSGTNEKVTDDSFEGRSSRITFHASATQMFRLDPGFTGWVKATVSPQGAGGQANSGTEVTLSVVAFTAS